MTAKKPAEKDSTKSAPLMPKAVAAKIFDVSRPGKTAATAGSRPVIVGHSPMIKQDPMMTTKSTSSQDPTTTHKAEMVITPPKEQPEAPAPDKPAAEEQSESAAEKATSVPEKADQKAEETQLPESDSIKPQEDTLAKLSTETSTETEAETETKPAPEQPASDVPEPEATPPEEESPDKTEIDDDAADSDKDTLDTDDKKEKKNPKVDEAAIKKAAEIQAVIDSKKYYAPIHQKVTNNAAWLWIMICVLLIVVGVAAAIDAGYIDVGVKLPFDLIKNR